MNKVSEMSPVVRRFVEEAGHLTQSVGLGRVLGQMYAYLYFSPKPKNLGDMQEALGISKGGASVTVRQLEQWGAVKKIWVKGDRKDYYQADEWVGGAVRRAALDLVGRRMRDYTSFLDDSERALKSGKNGNGDKRFIEARLKGLRDFEQNVRKAWENPFVQSLLR